MGTYASTSTTVATAASRTTVSPSTSVVPMSATHVETTEPAFVATPPPTIADQFSSSLAGLEVHLFGTAIPASARDAVARLWLLLGRPPTAEELRGAVESVVGDGDALEPVADLL